MSRIGIFAGSFDPVHDGHIKFAMAAIKQAKIDKVYFLVEARPRHKPGITHPAHRLAMLKITLKNHKSLELLDFPDRQFSVAKTLPRLNQKFANDQLFLIIGSDVLEHLPSWPLATSLLKRMNLIVGRRQASNLKNIKQNIAQLPYLPEEVFVVTSPAAKLSSRDIRNKLLANQLTPGLSPIVEAYIKANWLYASPSNSSSAS